ncbi:MAG TPA: DEDD exonuclease domain-containing protein [Actinobacteria bacterium]|nr:DEDD exonuclease domain-containing protein [Actinomycetota bacterium]
MPLAGQRTFDDLGASLHEVPFCVLDLETTGLSPELHGITEIGAVRYVGGELTGTFDTLVNPDAPIPPTVTILTGITQFMVIDAPRIEEALPSLLEFIGDAVIVGHNIRFDMSFLNAAAIALGYGKLANRTVDTLGLAKRLVRNDVHNLRLDTLAAHFRSPTAPNHRALADAKATAHVFWELLGRAGDLGVTHLDDLLRLPTARGSAHYRKIQLTDGLPRSAGIYRFHDRDGTVIYVGKAKNLRTRVRGYFYGDTRRSITNMLRELDHITHDVCSHELEASITELRLIHAHRPKFNRRSRPPKSPHWIKLTDEEFPRLSVVRSAKDSGRLLLGPFRSRRAATLVLHALWDAVPIRRCRTARASRSAACGFADLGVAVCPCDGSVTRTQYGPIVERLIEGVENDPETLLAPIEKKMLDHARNARFEDAATLRDRHHSLARTLDDRRIWQTLHRAGTIRAVDADGSGCLIEHGRFVIGWSGNEPFDLHTERVAERSPFEETPPTPALHAEALLIWKWLTANGTRLLTTDAPLAYPAAQVRHLAAG